MVVEEILDIAAQIAEVRERPLVLQVELDAVDLAIDARCVGEV